MPNKLTSILPSAVLAALLLVLPFRAGAEAYISATYGSGPDEYSSSALSADAALPGMPLRLNLYLFKSGAAQSADVKQSVLGMDWDVSELITAGYKHNALDDGTVTVSGDEGKLSAALNQLWQSELRTRFDIGYTASIYQSSNTGNKELAQDKIGAGLRQGITPSLTLYAGHDEYTYDKNPKNIAYLLIKRTRNNSNVAYTLLGFPDHTNLFGISWQATDALTLDISSSKTVSVLDQLQQSKRLGVDYQLTDQLNLSAAVSKSTSTLVKTALGFTLLPATDDIYTEFSLGWAF
jgi:hypothetical protein